MLFADDPVAYFSDDGFAASALGPAEAEQLQQQALAEAQGLDASVALDEAPKLFFPHSFYKAYDPAWLTGHDFARIGRGQALASACFISPSSAGCSVAGGAQMLNTRRKASPFLA
jgi:hypothetical protein